MPEPIRLEPWHRLARGVPTYETVAHQAFGPEWEEITRVVQVAPLKGPLKQWGVALFDGIRRIRDWTLPGPLNASDAQKAAERLVNIWGIRTEDADVETGQERKPMSLEQPNGFAWINLKMVIVAMWRQPLTRANGIVVLNNMYFGRGTEVDWAMSLIQQAEAENNVALLDIKAVRYAADKGDKVQKNRLELLRTVREARQMATQIAITEMAMQPGEVIEQSPYSMLTA